MLVATVLLAAVPFANGAPGGSYVGAVPGSARIALMPPDIRYYLVTAGGNPRLHEAWTSDAEALFARAMSTIAGERGVEMTVLSREDLDEQSLVYEGLHAAVGEALIDHVVGGAALPSKNGNRVSDWTLGPGVSAIGKASGADYALFVHYRENQPSGGRVAFAILAAAAKVSIPTGSEHGFASLVDLRSGEIRWFGLLSDEGLELREEDGASALATQLLDRLAAPGGEPDAK